MGRITETRPSRLAIMGQLEELLQKEFLVKAPSQAALLQVIVDAHLRGKRLSGDDLGVETFPNFVRAASTDTRVTAHKLRKGLIEYYAGEGLSDLVVFKVGKGKNYPFKADYNNRNLSVKYYESALAWMSNEGSYPWKIYDALAFCDKALWMNPHFTATFALMGELFLYLASCHLGNPYECCFDDFQEQAYPARTTETVSLARWCATEAVRRDEKNWRSHAALGAYCACRGLWRAAKKCFDWSIALGTDEVAGDPCYSIWLIATGRFDDALRIVTENLRWSPMENCWFTLYALVLSFRGDYSGGMLLKNIKREPQYMSRAALACILSSAGDHDKAFEVIENYFMRAEMLGEGNPIAGLGFWAMMSGYAGDQQRAASLLQILESAPPSLFNKRSVFGLEQRDLVYSPEGKDLEMEGSFSSKSWRQWICPWELALAYLGTGDHRNALRQLKRAQIECHPMMMWLHLWDFLHPLYRYVNFTELILQMNLPFAKQYHLDRHGWGTELLVLSGE